MTDIAVSIIIVSFNTKELLKNCLASIYTQTKNIAFEVIVSDNGSVDGSPEMIKGDFPQAVLLENSANIGFGAANNRAAECAGGRYLLFLNSDTLLLNNAVYEFYLFAEGQEGEYILGCYLKDGEGRDCTSYSSFCGPLRGCVRLACFSFPGLQKMLEYISFTTAKNQENHVEKTVDCIIGADLFISKSSFDKLNGFDNNFFMYYEDEDLCRRALLLNIKAMVITGPQIMHIECGSSKNRFLKVCNFQKSYLTYQKKYLGVIQYKLLKILFLCFCITRFFSLRHTFSEKKILLGNSRTI